MRARAIQCAYYLLAGILRTGELITDRFTSRDFISTPPHQKLSAILLVMVIKELIILSRIF